MDSKKEVLCKWGTDGKLAVIYQIGDLLLFYATEKDPKFKRGEAITVEEADATKPYKAMKFEWDRVPNDAYMMFTF